MLDCGTDVSGPRLFYSTIGAASRTRICEMTTCISGIDMAVYVERKTKNLVDAYIKGARKHYPRAYLHFVKHYYTIVASSSQLKFVEEDFGVPNAPRILDEPRASVLMFDDDVQGTGCVTVADLMAAAHVSKVSPHDMRILSFGSASAGLGRC